jgi:flagellin
MLAIKNNLMAVNAARQLGISYDSLARSVERLSSGLRINSARDDAAGLAVRELMRADIAVLRQGSRNAQDGISLLQTMEGAMQTMDDALVRMKQLAQQAVTGTYSSAQRVIMNSEFAEMASEIERIATTTKFNDTTYLDNTNTVDIQVGDSTDKITVTGVDMTKSGLGIETGSAGYEAVSEYGVAAAGDNWLTMDNTTAGSNTVVLNIQFTDADGTDEDQITVTYTVAGSTTVNKTLQEVIDDVNTQSQNLGNDADGNSKNYAMASTQYDSTTNKYYLKLASRGTAMDGATITVTTGADTACTNGLAVAKAQTDFDVTEDNGQDYDGDGVLELNTGTGINILTASAANTAMTAVTAAITTKDTARAAFGYKMNRLDNTVAVINIQAENMLAAESRISDVDVATEMAAMTRYQVLAQAGVAMLAQANMMPQMALTLLR